MDRKESNKYSMYKAVISFFYVNAAELDTFQALKNAFEEFKCNVEIIGKLNTQHQTVAKGATSTKNSFRDELVDELDTMCSSLYSFSKKKKDLKTKEIVDITKSELANLKDNLLLDKAEVVIGIIDANFSELGGYDFTYEKIAAIKETLKSFETAKDGKGVKANSAVVARVDLSKEFARTDEILADDLDNLIKQRKKSNPDFYTGYIQARNIKDLGGGKHGDSSDEKPSKDQPQNATTAVK
jgi:hypothetical protein